MTRYLLLCLALTLSACEKNSGPQISTEATAKPAASAPAEASAEKRLDEILSAQPADVQARYAYRHPKETLTFFGIKPGMTVVEGLPGGGWYSKILIPYLGPKGSLIGVDYAKSMFPLFGFFSDEFIASKETWVTDWVEEASGWRGEQGAPVSAFVFGSMPAELAGTADVALMIRATHNLARFESEGGYLTQAMADLFNVLKPGGVLGVVQHMAADDAPDAWADGTRGYLKREFVINAFEAAGFEYEDSLAINENFRDQPGEDDVVWRLPPTLATSKDNPALQEELKAIGESNRMTLRFRKPGG